MSALPIEKLGYSKAGVLDKWIKQPVDNSPAESANGVMTLREKWKGPYSEGRNLLTHIKVGMAIGYVYGVLQPDTTTYKFYYPDCPVRNGNSGVWILTDISINELEAGEHCTLELTYQPSYYGDTTVTELVDVKEQDVWSMSWGTYTANPWYFAADGERRKNYKKPQTWKPSYEQHPPTPNWTAVADRSDIEEALNHNPEFKEPFIVYTPNPDKPAYKLYLEPASFYLAKKVKMDRSAAYHFPIVVHQTQKKGPWKMSYYDPLAENIDIVYEALPDDCPYTFDNRWVFIRTGDDITQTKDETTETVTYTRRERWEGVLKDSYDKNYYSPWPAEHSETGIINGRWDVRWL